MTGPTQRISQAATWQDLARDLLFAIDQLDASDRSRKVAEVRTAIVITVADDMRSLVLNRFCPRRSQTSCGTLALRMDLRLLPAATDMVRDDEMAVPNASIDRAISKAACEMLSWTREPDTFELLEHRRYSFYLQWPGETPALVNEYAYGLWDE